MSYHEGSNWQAKKEDEKKPLYDKAAPIKTEGGDVEIVLDAYREFIVRTGLIDRNNLQDFVKNLPSAIHSPLGIDVEAKNKIIQSILDNANGSWSDMITEGFEAGYAASLPQSNSYTKSQIFQAAKDGEVSIIDAEHIVSLLEKEYQSSTSEEEKDLWEKSLSFFLDEFMSKPFTTKEEVISELMLTYKISKR